MTVWFNDLSMTDDVHKARQRGLDLDVETREAVLRRSRYLDGADERLLRLALEGNMSYRAMNRVIGLKSGGGTYRRVRSLLRRLREPVVVALLDWPGELSAEQREIGIRWFVKKQSGAQIAQATGVSVWDVRKTSAFLLGWARGTLRGRARCESN